MREWGANTANINVGAGFDVRARTYIVYRITDACIWVRRVRSHARGIDYYICGAVMVLPITQHIQKTSSARACVAWRVHIRAVI